MSTIINNSSTPGPLDPLALNSDSALNKDHASESSLNTTLAHQGDIITGGNKENLRVVFCSNLDFSMNFEEVTLLTKQYGKIEKIRLKIAENETTFNAYIVFNDYTAADKAHLNLNGHNVNGLVLQTKLYDIKNLKEDSFDYIPEDVSVSKPERKAPSPIWFVATYKKDKDNF